MSSLPCIRVWLGGSFDPIHLGHLQMISHVYKTLTHTFPQLPIVAKLLPTAGSPLKDTPTSTQHRLAMMTLAIEPLPFIAIDTFELQGEPPVYSFNTFSQFKQRYPNDILIFIVGQDSIEQLDKWYRGYELMTLTNLWVLPRPALSKPSLADTTTTPNAAAAEKCCHIHLDQRLTPFIINSPKDLINQSTNHIYIDKFVVPDIASSDIRAWLDAAHATSLKCALASLPYPVYDYIMAHQLYRHAY